jgi:alpha-tubulin suppressor-like RCC1 family protein
MMSFQNFDVIDVAVGIYHTLFLKSDKMAYGIGLNSYGRLGDGTFTSRYQLTPVTSINSNISRVFGGYEHSMVMKNKEVYSFGRNQDGQLCIASTEIQQPIPTKIPLANIIEVSTSYSNTMLLNDQNVMYSCGTNTVRNFKSKI